jgi:Flp pilus assembly protein TadG
VLILVALAVPLMLVLVSLVVDGGVALSKRRTLQGAADAAALAAAQSLPHVALMLSAASQYSQQNGGPAIDHTCDSGSPPCLRYPYQGDANRVEVKLEQAAVTYFANAVGLGGVLPDVSARAVASPNLLPVSVTVTTTTVGPPTTIPGTTSTIPGTTVPDSTSTVTVTVGGDGAVAYVNSTRCDADPGGAAIQWSGAPSTLAGLMTRGGIAVVGNTSKSALHVLLGRYSDTANGCRLFWGETSSPNFPDVRPLDPSAGYPVPPPSPAPPPGCPSTGTNSIGNNWTDTHPPGVYCWTSGRLSFAGNGLTFDGYTFFAPQISLGGNNLTFRGPPAAAGGRSTLFDAYGGDASSGSPRAALDISSSNVRITGDMFAPGGTIDVSAGGVTTGAGGASFMESEWLKVSGNFATFIGSGPFLTSTTTTTTTVVTGTTVPPTTTVTPPTTIPGSTTTSTTVSTSTTTDGFGLDE